MKVCKCYFYASGNLVSTDLVKEPREAIDMKHDWLSHPGRTFKAFVADVPKSFFDYSTYRVAK